MPSGPPPFKLPDAYGPLDPNEVAAMDQAQRAELLADGDELYSPAVFLINAQGTAPKAIIYLAEATIALTNGQALWASIAAYYSLFHLAITMMYLHPPCLPAPLLHRLLTGREGGSRDPTSLIAHRDIRPFLQACESQGLPKDLRTTLDKARELRYFVNYGPRIVWRAGDIHFTTSTHSPSELSPLLAAAPSLIRDSLRWVGAHGKGQRLLVNHVVFCVPSFFTQADLLYMTWCSAPSLALARTLAGSLTTA